MEKIEKIRNIQELTDSLSSEYANLKNGSIPTGQAKEMSNMAGKIINSCKVQLEYNKFTNNKTKIKFLEME